MDSLKNKKIISLIGPPGSGKGTQAGLLAKEFNLFHFDTGNFLKKLFKDSATGDEELLKFKKEYDDGELVNPEFVTKKVLEEIKLILNKSEGVIFSGSPRTLYEAENEIPIFNKLADKSDIRFFYIKIDREESIKRGSGRLICEKSGHPVPNLPEYQEIRKSGICPIDGSRLIRKSLDKPELYGERFDQYLGRTKPVINKIKEMGYGITEINGEQSIEKVFEDIKKYM